MPLGTPTYNDYPSPTKGTSRSSGGGRKPRGGTSTPPAMPTRTPTPQPTPAQPAPTGNPLGGLYGDVLNPTWSPSGMTGSYDDNLLPNVTAEDRIMGAMRQVGRPLSRGTVTGPLKQQQRADAVTDYNQSTYQDNILGQYGAWSDSQMDALQTKYDLGLSNMTALYDLNKGFLEGGLETDLGLLNERKYRDTTLPQEALQGKRDDLATYFDIIAKREGIRRDQFTNDRDYFNALNDILGQERGLAFDRYQSNDQYMAGVGQDNQKQYGFAARDFATDQAGARLQRDTSRRAATSDAAGRGAFGSAGFKDNISDILSQYGLNNEAATLALDRANQSIGERDRSIGNERANLGFGYEGQVLGFDKDAAGLTRSAKSNLYGYQDDLQGFRKQRIDLAAQGRELEQTDKALASLAREYGIKQTDIENQFNNSVTRLGLDAKAAREDLEAMLNSGNAQIVAQGLDFMQQMMAYQDGTIPQLPGMAGGNVR